MTKLKTVLITGASRGIGRATALACAARGWSVAVNFLSNAAAAESVVREIESIGGTAVALQADISCEREVLGLFDAAQAAFGSLTGLVINAGVVGPSQPLADMTGERMKQVFDINVYGAYLCAREGARRLPVERGGPGGAIVLVSSAASRLGSPFEYVDYAGSKGAIDTLAIGLSKELAAQGVRVNAVRPGLIDTEIHASGGQPDRARRLGATMPIGRPGTAREVAEAIVWLLSDAASYTTGALLDVAGGR